MGALVMANIPHKNIETEIAHIAGTKRVRCELLSERNTAAVTISKNRIAFNSNCIMLLPNTEHIEVLLHPNERLLAVRKTAVKNKNALPWKNRALSAKKLSHVLYQLMGWQKEWQYKITANCFAKNDNYVIIFDLNCCEFRISNSEKGRKTARALPCSWLSCFGDGLPEYIMLCRRALAEHLDKWEINATPSPIPYFGHNIRTLSQSEAKQRIDEMRCGYAN
jgi:hypothetical protein